MSKADLWLLYGSGTPFSGAPDAFHWDGSVWQPVDFSYVAYGGVDYSVGQYRARSPRDRYIISGSGVQMMIASTVDNNLTYPRRFVFAKWQPSDNTVREWVYSQSVPAPTSYSPFPADFVDDPAHPGQAYIPMFNTEQIAHWDGSSSNFTGWNDNPGSADLWTYAITGSWPGWDGPYTVSHYSGIFPGGSTPFVYFSPSYVFYHNSQWYFTVSPAESGYRISGTGTGGDFSGLCKCASMGAPAPLSVDVVKLFKLFSTGNRFQEVYPLPPVEWSGNVFLPNAKISMDPSLTTGDDLDWLYMLDASGTLHTAHTLTGFWDTLRGENSATGIGIYLHESTNTLYAFVVTGKNMNNGGYQGDNPPGNRLHVLRLDGYSGGIFTWTEVAHVDSVLPSTVSNNLSVTTDDSQLFIIWTFETTAQVYNLDLASLTFTHTHVDFGTNAGFFLRSMKASGRSRAQLIGV